MNDTLEISEKYKLLFMLPEAKGVVEGRHNNIPNVVAQDLAKIDIVIITGGRSSSKSFVSSLLAAYWARVFNYRVLFTRYTMKSSDDTTIPDFMEKVDMLGYHGYFRVRKDRITAKAGKAKIVFKGIKTSAGNQTASLKSLKDFNCFILDEAEEMPNYEDWQKIYLSMRATDVQNLCVISMNPSDKEFWVYKKFFEERGVEEGHNGHVGNILYIHTTYHDVNPKFIPRNVVTEYERMRVESPAEYDHIVMGKWLDNTEGAIFKRDEVTWFRLSDLNLGNVEMRIGFIDVADQGLDYLSMPIGYMIGDMIYVVDWYFSQDNTDITIPTCSTFSDYHKLDYLGIETNGVGSVFSKEVLNKVRSSTQVMFVNQKAGKHTRIIASAGGVKRKFAFRSDVSFGSDYDIALRQLFMYNKDKSLNNHDDAPDSITGLKLLFEDLIG